MSDALAFLSDLNQAQKNAVTTESLAVCVKAGPGTGKTRVLTCRAAYLIAAKGVPPERILAVTFTNKAAEELHDRLETLVGQERGAVQTYTFHSFALRLLRDNAPRIGLDARFAVYDEIDQIDLLGLAQERMGQNGLERGVLVKRRAEISAYKNSYGRDPADDPEPERVSPELQRVAEAYRNLLREYNALDFDDLLMWAVRLLQEDEHTRRSLQDSIAHLLVDEFHDLNVVQYELMKLTAPPGRSVMVVADDDQAIYGWRGGDRRLLARFVREYRAQMYRLDMNYRSTPNILTAAHGLFARASDERRQPPKPVNAPGAPVEHHIFPSLDDEQTWLKNTLLGLHAAGVPYGQMAILYRLHNLRDPLAAFLSNGDQPIPLRLIQPDPFFGRPGAREILRYLQFLAEQTASRSDARFAPAMNFPRVIADELAMLQLRGLAAGAQLSLSELGRRIDEFPQVAPLTRAAVRRFMRQLDRLQQTPAEPDVAAVVNWLFDLLEAGRSPYRRRDFETLRGFMRFLTLPTEVASLRAALDAGRPVHLLTAQRIDALCAAVIIEHTVSFYLQGQVSIHLVPPATAAWPDPVPADAFVVRLGLDDGQAPPSALSLSPRQHPPLTYSLSTVAWRLCQGLLISYEQLDQQRFVVLDLETTGKYPAIDEAIEVGACEIVNGARGPAAFHSLLKPRQRFIGAEAQLVHGLTARDVADSPYFDEVVTDLASFIGDGIIAGHNILEFDAMITNRALRLAGEAPLTNCCVDTLSMARRLLPGRSHSLEALAGDYLKQPVRHRAASDAATEADLLLWLLQENRWHKELHALVELLPLVAWGMRASEAPLVQENALLHRAATRVSVSPFAQSFTERVIGLLPVESIFDERADRAWLREDGADMSLEDMQWQQLRTDWREQVALFKRARRDHSLQAFLDYVALVDADDTAGSGDPAGEMDSVTMMTLHSAKGKEFACVFIIGLEDNIIPMMLRRDKPDALAEERRVLYVGMTRARERLYLSSVLRRQPGRLRTPSRFVLDLPSGVITRYNH